MILYWVAEFLINLRSIFEKKYGDIKLLMLTWVVKKNVKNIFTESLRVLKFKDYLIQVKRPLSLRWKLKMMGTNLILLDFIKKKKY